MVALAKPPPPPVHLRRWVRSFFRVPERVTSSQWCERHLELPPGKQESRAGAVRFDDRPYQREPLDAFDDPTVTDIVFAESSTAAEGWNTDVVRLEDRYGRSGTSAP